MISAVLHVLSIGENMLTIWGAKAEAYLAVDHNGNVYTTVSIPDDYSLRDQSMLIR